MLNKKIPLSITALSQVLPSPLKVILAKNYSYLRHQHLTAKNTKLKGKGKNKQAFLLATGPSIKKYNLKKLKNEDVFSVSNAFLHKDIKIIKPKFHFFAPFHSPLKLKNFVRWMKRADGILPPQTNIFLGHTDQALVKKFNLFPNREIYYLITSSLLKINTDITKPVLSPQSVPIMVLPVLLYMGYNPIYLLGCDHTVLRDYGKTAKNFYDPKDDVRQNSTKNKAWDSIIKLHKNNLKLFEQYDKYYRAAKDPSRIINLSHDTWLETFPQKNYQDII